MSNINFELDDRLHIEFKIICLRQEIEMKDKLTKWIKNFVEKNKDDLIIRKKR